MKSIYSFYFLLFFLVGTKAFAQDVDLYLNDHYLSGKSIIKVNRDFDDEYMWILARNNEVYRLNTLTRQLDDYTAQFKTLSGYQIFDIAGISPNIITLAIKNIDSAIVVNYDNGVISYPFRNNFFGIKGNVTGIGASAIITESAYGFADHPALLVATDFGFFRYTYASGVVNYNGDTPSRIYSATYRDQIFLVHDLIDTTAVNLSPALAVIYGAYNGVFRTGNPFGDTINTAYVTANQLPSSAPYFTPDAFWGNQNGLFQEKFRNTRPFLSPYRHYLDHIKINKITDIYGLTSFGSNAARENLLIGTDNGLYYSNSFFHAGLDTALDNFTLYHYPQLGNMPINFVEVNAIPLSGFPGCENGIWVATNDGVFLIKPDFTPYLDTSKEVSSIHFNDPQMDTTSKHICAGDSIVAQLNRDISATTIQWFKDGTALNNASGTSLAITATGDYNAILYDPCAGTHVKSNHLKVTVTDGPVFTFNYPDKIQHCNTNPDTLKATGSAGYRYRWYSDGVLNGDTTSEYIVTQSGKYKVEVSACTNSWVPSKEVEVDLISLPVPLVSADKPVYCAGETASLSVNVTPDPAYAINWYRNGTLLANKKELAVITATVDGSYTVMVSSNIANCSQTSAALPVTFTPPPVFTFNYPDVLQYCQGTAVILQGGGSSSYQYRWYKDGALTGDVGASLTVNQSGKYKVEVSACAGSWVPSKEVQVNFIALPVPVITTGKLAYCIGDNAVLSAGVLPGPSYTITWYNDNALLPSNTNLGTLTTNIAGNYTVSIVNNTVNSDGVTCSATSAAQSLLFNPPPAVSIDKIIPTTLCDGQVISLSAHFSGGIVKWSTGETTEQISVTASGTYQATVTSPAGCTADASTDIAFLPNPLLTVADTSVCTYQHQTVTLTAPPGFSAYAWNGAPGGTTYEVSRPQTVALTVTDANGCQATREIKVAEHCAQVYIPNTFTPNNDGINDTWVIEGLNDDQTVTVRVMNRYGSQVFESKGYGIPWNGEYRGKKLTTGTYYYIITAKNGTQKFSGSITIVY